MTDNNKQSNGRSDSRAPYRHEWYGLSRTTRGFLPFEEVFPGSTFFIRQEVSRGHKYPSRDRTLYRKAVDGFYAVAVEDGDKAICLMPEDLCVPVRA